MAENSSLPRPSLPYDIEAEILLWLPVKALKRFQCACKSWYSLISSPQFQKDHFRRAKNKPPLLLTHKRELDDDKNITVRFSTYNHNIKEGTLSPLNNFSKLICISPSSYMKSCLGLVCIFHRFCNDPILICNPSTQELISVPPSRGPHISVGFGFATSTQEFKLVRVFFRVREWSFCCEVFTLGTDSWRKMTCPPFPIDVGIAPFLHKALHFLPHVPHEGVKDTDCIVVFDIDTEEYRQAIPLPAFYYSLGDCEHHDGIMLGREFLRLSTLGGSLCLTFDFVERSCRLELWLLKDYNKANWVKAYDIDVSPMFPYPGYRFWTYPTDNMVDDNILLNCSTQGGAKLVGYNPKDGTVTLKKNEERAATFYMETFYSLQSR